MSKPSKSQPVKNSKAESMNKNGLISSVAESSGLSKSDSSKAIEAILQSIQLGLKNGKDVRIVGFGTFIVTKREARNAHNPRTKEKIKIPPSKHPKFRAGKILKEAIA